MYETNEQGVQYLGRSTCMTPMNKVYSSGEGQHVWHQLTRCKVVGKVNMYDTNEQGVQ